MLTAKLVHGGQLTWLQAFDLLSTGPARLLNLIAARCRQAHLLTLSELTRTPLPSSKARPLNRSPGSRRLTASHVKAR